MKITLKLTEKELFEIGVAVVELLPKYRKAEEKYNTVRTMKQLDALETAFDKIYGARYDC